MKIEDLIKNYFSNKSNTCVINGIMKIDYLDGNYFKVNGIDRNKKFTTEIFVDEEKELVLILPK